ncbi:MAG: hypothetical protein WCD45_09750 [Gallionella sp.]
MMTLIVVIAFAMIVFIALLRYDIHKHKYSPEAQAKLDAAAKAKELADKSNPSDKK